MFKGTYTALVTPFNKDGSVDYGALRALVDAQERLSRDMTPDRQLVRPLLVVLPADTPEATHG